MNQGELLHKILNDGYKMRLNILEKEEINRIQSFTNQLIYHLRKQDVTACVEVICRQYLCQQKQVPHLFIETVNNKTLFLAAGYAFVTGLNGGVHSKHL